VVCFYGTILFIPLKLIALLYSLTNVINSRAPEPTPKQLVDNWPEIPAMVNKCFQGNSGFQGQAKQFTVFFTMNKLSTTRDFSQT
jgi:hypothetical protein